MTTRVTIRQLEAAIARLNTNNNRPDAPYTYSKEGGYLRAKACVGHFKLAQAYGGVALHEFTNTGGAVKDWGGGYQPKRELMGKIDTLLNRGIR